MKKVLLISLSLLFVSITFSQQNKTYLTGSLGYGVLVPHKSIVNHLKSKPSLVGEIGFLKTYTTTEYNKAFRQPSLGMDLHINNTGNKRVIGNGYALDFFGIAPLGKGKAPLQFKTGFGIGYIEKPYDSILNTGNNAIGSYFNVHILIHFEKPFYLTDNTRVNAGLAISHFSNAATQMPNYGLNFIHFTLGYEFMVSPKNDVKIPEVGIPISSTTLKLNTWQTSVNAGWGIKENNNLSGVKYNVWSFTLREEYRLNIKSSFQGALNIYQNYAKEAETNTAFQSGVSLGYFLNFDKLKTGFTMGMYTSNGAGTKLGDLFYHKYIIEYKLTKKIYAQLLLKAHWAAADFFNVTLGYTFIKKNKKFKNLKIVTRS